jgi:hypothetical protein
MASTYTNLGVEKMATGENAGTWGTKTNTNLEILEQIAGGYVAQSIAGGEQTTALTVSDGSTGAAMATKVIDLTGTITGNQTVTIPNGTEMQYCIKNSTSGAYTVLVKGASDSGSGYTFSTTNKKTALIYMDGTDVNEITTGGDVVDDTSPQLGGNLDVNGYDITSASNADVDIIPNGTGDVVLGADTVKVGDAAAAVTLTSNGAGALTVTTGGTEDLVLSTNSGTNSSTITITDAAGGDVTITPNGAGDFVIAGNSTQAGKLVLGADTDDTGSFVASITPGVLTESTAYTLPTAYAGTTGDALTSTDAGVLSWTTIASGVSWQAVVTGATQTAVAGRGYFINTTSNACTLTLPAGTIGDEVNVIDYAGTFDTNNLTVEADGSEKIHGSTDDLTVAIERAAFALVFSDSTQGWLLKDK